MNTTFNDLSEPSLIRHDAYIGGAWCKANNDDSLEVTNPASGQSLGTVASVGIDQVDLAVSRATDAFGGWSQLLPQERSQFLRAWYEQIVLNRQDLAKIITLEQGKPFSDSLSAINTVSITGPPVPFGGMKHSGMGREGSSVGLEAFTELKYICTDTGTPDRVAAL